MVLPDDSAKPIIDAINRAEKFLRFRCSFFPRLTCWKRSLHRAHRRGVQVRIMLNPTRRSGEKQNDDSRKQLTDAGIEVIDSNPAFDLTHGKSAWSWMTSQAWIVR